jgi:hypothetical protein
MMQAPCEHPVVPTGVPANSNELAPRLANAQAVSGYHLPAATKAGGRVLAVRGAVVDVVFDGEPPGLNEALRVVNGRRSLILEVQQLLGLRTVRTIGLGQTDRLRGARWIEK